MKINESWYQDWFRWARAMNARLLGRERDDPSIANRERIARFAIDCQSIIQHLIAIWSSVPHGGKVWTLLPKLLAWAMANPDPLQPVRQRMDAMRKRWNEEIGQL